MMIRFRTRHLAILLPGMLIAATGVGAGDLITASLAGMAVGPAILWAVPFGVLLKWVLTEGIARWHLATGTSLFEGWIVRLGRWIEWSFMCYLVLWSYVVGGALVNACGVAGHSMLPVTSDGALSKTIWGVLHSITGIVLVRRGGFRLFEKVMSLTVAVMFITVIATAVPLWPEWPVLMRGLLLPAMPARSTSWVIAVLGGVGGTVTILAYGYWIEEKGRKGVSGLAASRIDLGVAYFLTGLFSIAMVIIVQRLSADQVGGLQLAVAIAEQLGAAMGDWARWTFLIGFWAAVFSSLLGVWQGVPYLFADFVRLRRRKRGSVHGPGEEGGMSRLENTRSYRTYLLAIGIVPLSSLWLRFEIIQLAYALIGAFFMPMLALTLFLLNNRVQWVGRTYRNGFVINALLILTLLFFTFAGGLQIYDAVLGAG